MTVTSIDPPTGGSSKTNEHLPTLAACLDSEKWVVLPSEFIVIASNAVSKILCFPTIFNYFVEAHYIRNHSNGGSIGREFVSGGNFFGMPVRKEFLSRSHNQIWMLVRKKSGCYDNPHGTNGAHDVHHIYRSTGHIHCNEVLPMGMTNRSFPVSMALLFTPTIILLAIRMILPTVDSILKF